MTPIVDEWRTLSQSESETDELATRLASFVVPGTVVALVGNLGAGKTRLVRGVAEALGVDRRSIASPTFVLVHEYEGRLPVYHFDIYRLSQPREFLDLGADEYLNGEGVCFVEWADRIDDFLPDDHLRVEIRAVGPTTREFQFQATGPVSQRLLKQVRAN